MKIRLDFVTNSSSSSFVTYDLSDSEFCRYLYDKMQELGLEYSQYCYDRPASSVRFDRDSFSGDISCQYEGLACDNYAPEIYSPYFDFDRLVGSKKHGGYKNGIFIEVTHHIKDEWTRYLYMKMLRDLFGYNNRRYKSIGRVIEDAIKKEYPSYDYGDNDIIGYRTLCMKDHENWRLSSAFFTFLEQNKSEFDECLRCYDKHYIFAIPTGKETEDIIYSDKDLLLVGNSEGYKESERDSDIEHMRDRFIKVVSDFLPIKDLPASDRIMLQSLYMDDVRNGKLNCNVYMSCTD